MEIILGLASIAVLVLALLMLHQEPSDTPPHRTQSQDVVKVASQSSPLLLP